MQHILVVIEFAKAHWLDIATCIAYLIATASIIVKITPTQKDDAILGKIIAFLSKYIALNVQPPTK